MNEITFYSGQNDSTYNGTELPLDKESISDKFNEASSIVIPFIVFIAILLLSALVYLMARNKRLSGIYQGFGFANRPEGYEEIASESFDEFDNEDPANYLLNGKLELNDTIAALNSGKSDYTISKVEKI